MKWAFTISILITLLACTPHASDNPNFGVVEKIIAKEENTLEIRDTLLFDFANDHSTGYHLQSKLNCKSKKLNSLRTGFKIHNYGKIVTNTSRVYNAIYDKPIRCFYTDTCFAISNLQNLEDSIYEIHYLKGTTQISNQESLHLKVSIEEIIFYSEADAKSLLKYINYIRGFEFYWKSIDKTPSHMYRDSNKIYFIKLYYKPLAGNTNALPKRMGGLMEG